MKSLALHQREVLRCKLADLQKRSSKAQGLTIEVRGHRSWCIVGAIQERRSWRVQRAHGA